MCDAAPIGGLADIPLVDLLDRIAAADPSPGAGPAAAWTCALAAALLEMVSAIELRGDPEDGVEAARRRDRASALRAHALTLADRDIAAYQAVVGVRRERDRPGYAEHLREALAAAADPPLEIAEAAAEVTLLAADAAAHARGGVRGEAITAAVLAAAAVAACVPMVELNLGGAGADPRLARVRALADRARRDRERAGERPRQSGEVSSSASP